MSFGIFKINKSLRNLKRAILIIIDDERYHIVIAHNTATLIVCLEEVVIKVFGEYFKRIFVGTPKFTHFSIAFQYSKVDGG